MDYSRYTNVSPYDPMAAPAGNNEESEEDDYDPSNFVAGAADSEPSSTNATPTMESAEADNGSAQPVNAPAQEQNPNTNGAVKQPRTVGGFIVDDEDDEEEANGLNGSLSTAGTTQVAQAADNTFSTSEQSMSEKATQDTSVAAPAHSTVAAAQPISTSSLRSPVAASNPSGSGTSLNMSSQSSAPVSKTRLPQDRVGILEDRIAEDPRGDIDAWLSLIADYRGKNKFDDARKVYERFFQVFPSAVSLLPQNPAQIHALTYSRPNSGSLMRRWNSSAMSSTGWSKSSTRLLCPSQTFSCGRSTSITFVGEITSSRIPVATPERWSLKHMSLCCRTLVLTKTPASSGKSI